MTNAAGERELSSFRIVRASPRPRHIGVVVAIAASIAIVGCSRPLGDERALAMARWVQQRNLILHSLDADAYQTASLETAQAKLMEILERDPDNESARLLLAHVLLQDDQLGRSAALLQELERDGHVNPQVYYLTGVTKELTRDYTAAAKYYARALRARPGHQPYVTATAEALLASGNVSGAKAFLGAVDSPLKDSAEWFCLQAEAACLDQRYQPAAALYRDALQLASATGDDDGDEWIVRRLADVYRKLDRYADAVELLETLSRSPHIADPNAVREELAWCYLKLKRTQDAAETINLLKSGHQGMSALWTALAQLHMEEKDWSRTRHALSRAYIADPSDLNSMMLSTFISVRAGDTDAATKTLARWRDAKPPPEMTH